MKIYHRKFWRKKNNRKIYLNLEKTKKNFLLFFTHFSRSLSLLSVLSLNLNIFYNFLLLRVSSIINLTKKTFFLKFSSIFFYFLNSFLLTHTLKINKIKIRIIFNWLQNRSPIFSRNSLKSFYLRERES